MTVTATDAQGLFEMSVEIYLDFKMDLKSGILYINLFGFLFF